MPSHTFQSVIVTGVNSGDESEVLRAHQVALSVFDDGLVSPVSPVGHNFIASFCVFPSGSGNQRDAQLLHQAAIEKFVEWLRDTDLDYVATKWDDEMDPEISHSHTDDLLPKLSKR